MLNIALRCAAQDFTAFCLQLYAEIFSGEPLSEEEEKLFVTYNAGLFALTDWEPSFNKAKAARETLETNLQKRFEAARDAGRLGEDKYTAQRMFAEGKFLVRSPLLRTPRGFVMSNQLTRSSVG